MLNKVSAAVRDVSFASLMSSHGSVEIAPKQQRVSEQWALSNLAILCCDLQLPEDLIYPDAHHRLTGLRLFSKACVLLLSPLHSALPLRLALFS